MASSLFKIRKLTSNREKMSAEDDCFFSVNHGPVTPQKRDVSQFEECRQRAQVQRMKNAFRTMSFRSEPTIGEEYLQRTSKCNFQATCTKGDPAIDKKSEELIHDFVPGCFEHIQNCHHYRSDIARLNSGFKVVYLCDDERAANTEMELRRVYGQSVKSVNPNACFKAQFQRLPGSKTRSTSVENKASFATPSQKCKNEGIGKTDQRNKASLRCSRPKVLGKDPRGVSADSTESTGKKQRFPCDEDKSEFIISSDDEVPYVELEKTPAKPMKSQSSFQSVDSDFSGRKPPVTTPDRISRRSSVRTAVYENDEGDNGGKINGTPFPLEASVKNSNHSPHHLAPFISRFPHLKASSVPVSCHTRQKRRGETAIPSWQEYRILCDAFRPDISPQDVLHQKRYPNAYKRPKFATSIELEYYIKVVSETNNTNSVLYLS